MKGKLLGSLLVTSIVLVTLVLGCSSTGATTSTAPKTTTTAPVTTSVAPSTTTSTPPASSTTTVPPTTITTTPTTTTTTPPTTTTTTPPTTTTTTPPTGSKTPVKIVFDGSVFTPNKASISKGDIIVFDNPDHNDHVVACVDSTGKNVFTLTLAESELTETPPFTAAGVYSIFDVTYQTTKCTITVT